MSLRTMWRPFAAVAAMAVVLSAITTASAAGRPLPADGSQVLAQSSAPSVQLSKTVVKPDGDTITVTGTGFLPTLATGTRPPLAGIPSGTYIAFGAFADVWKPSAGAPSSARPTMTAADRGLFWAVPEASRSIVGIDDSVALNPDGSFTATLTVKKNFPGALADGNYGIYTYAGSGAVQPLYETFTAVTFSASTATTTPSATATTPATASPSSTATAAPSSSATTAPSASATAAPATSTAAPAPPAAGNAATTKGSLPLGPILVAAGMILLLVAGGTAAARRSS